LAPSPDFSPKICRFLVPCCWFSREKWQPFHDREHPTVREKMMKKTAVMRELTFFRMHGGLSKNVDDGIV
jgi:hypothetical protein